MHKKRPTKVIEESKDPAKEIAFIKFPRENPVEVSTARKEGAVGTDYQIVKKLQELKNKRYTHIHTHPLDNAKDYVPMRVSSADLIGFFGNDKERAQNYAIKSVARNGEDLSLDNFAGNDESEKTMTVAYRNKKTGKVHGYIFITKTPRYYKMLNDVWKKAADDGDIWKDYFSSRLSDLEPYRKVYLEDFPDSQEEIDSSMRSFAKKYGLSIKYVAAEGERFDKKRGISNSSREAPTNSLEKLVLTSTFLVILSFFGFNLTSKVIQPIPYSDSISYLELILFFVFLVILFFLGQNFLSKRLKSQVSPMNYG